MQPQLVLEPANEKQLATVLRLANESKLAVIPRGGGTKLGWGNPPSRADIILSTSRLNRVLEHAWADLTVTVEAGCTVQAIQDTLAHHGQRLALDPLWPEIATVGGILSTNDSGALRLRFGALRDVIIGVTIALADGTLATSGGKVVKNVAGYDLPKLVTGALGTLGVITSAVFRLHPLPRQTRSFSTSTSSLEDAQRLVLAIQDSRLAHVALQSRFSNESTPTIDILFEGTLAGLDAQAIQLRTLCGSARIAEAPPEVWSSRQDLWSFSKPAESAIAKISILSTDLARTIDLFRRAADSAHLLWKCLMYPTGLGWLCLAGSLDKLHRSLTTLRADLEQMGGSLALLHRSAALPAFDAWGSPGDSLALMKSIKRQLDLANTLNPGRFLGGI
jgi:glycolate oxidase FAD binding subunit